MNNKRMTQLIEAIRSEAGRNMFDFSYFTRVPEGAKPVHEAFKAGGTCGTTACIAGMAKAVAIINGDEPAGGPTISHFWLSDWLGISLSHANQICYPENIALWPRCWQTKALEAADVLEHYQATGRLEHPYPPTPTQYPRERK